MRENLISNKRLRQLLPVIGWREWVALPVLGAAKIKAKIDTGARTSSLYAFDVHIFAVGHRKVVRFKFHPLQRSSTRTVSAEADLVEMRTVRDSGGRQTLRPVIRTSISLAGISWEIELTLAGREAMGFRMLLGREAVRQRFLVDPGRSFLTKKSRRFRTKGGN